MLKGKRKEGGKVLSGKGKVRAEKKKMLGCHRVGEINKSGGVLQVKKKSSAS